MLGTRSLALGGGSILAFILLLGEGLVFMAQPEWNRIAGYWVGLVSGTVCGVMMMAGPVAGLALGLASCSTKRGKAGILLSVLLLLALAGLVVYGYVLGRAAGH